MGTLIQTRGMLRDFGKALTTTVARSYLAFHYFTKSLLNVEIKIHISNLICAEQGSKPLLILNPDFIDVCDVIEDDVVVVVVVVGVIGCLNQAEWLHVFVALLKPDLHVHHYQELVKGHHYNVSVVLLKAFDYNVEVNAHFDDQKST